MPDVALLERIAAVSGELSPAQTRVARLVSEAPNVIAFGTVAEVAAEAGTSPQTVLRLAVRLGHDGFPGLQDEVRAGIVARLSPAASRIRHRPGSDLHAEVVAAEEHNLSLSLDADASIVAAAATLLADDDRQVRIVAADSWVGVGTVLFGQLTQLRDGVATVDGPVPRVAREIARLAEGDVLVVLDVRRYERWVLDVVEQARDAGVTVIALTDAVTSPLYAIADHALVVGVASPGPFESVTGVVALCHWIVTEVAARLRDRARSRLDEVEVAWERAGALVDG